jgi:glycoside/pentoside/hexuronide:cation symporter, GPH family
MIGTALAFAAMPLIVSVLIGRFGALGGWMGAGLILGFIGAGAYLFSLLGSGEKKENSAEKALPLAAAFKETLVNRSFLAYAAANLMICFIWSWFSSMVPFFTNYVLGFGEGQMSLLFGGMFIAAIFFYPLWRWLAMRLGSKRTLVLAVVLFVVFLSFVLVVGNLIQALVMMIFVGGANSGITLVRDIVLSDVIDEDETRTGKRREGSYFGATAFVERFSLV